MDEILLLLDGGRLDLLTTTATSTISTTPICFYSYTRYCCSMLTHEFMAGALKPTSWNTSLVRCVFTLRVLAAYNIQYHTKYNIQKHTHTINMHARRGRGNTGISYGPKENKTQ